jgi:phosphoribosyl 1,2-cyclic phosphodiesterase
MEYNAPMLAISLQSGSNGNSIYVEAAGMRLLFDAGISGRQAAQRLAAHGRDIRDVHAVILSHDHADHVCCAGVYQRKFALPIYATAKTFHAAQQRYALGRVEDVRHFQAGDVVDFATVRVETVATAHDGVDGVGFVVDDGHSRLGILTDLGHVFDGLAKVIGTLDAVFLESNYDPGMLRDGPYPPFLKRRIEGAAGHISNQESAELLRDAATDRMNWACLAHLSEQNNDPAVALETHRRINADGVKLLVASRYDPVGPLSV